MRQSLTTILGVILFLNVLEVIYHGRVKDLGEERMIQLIECSEPKPSCEDNAHGATWLFGGISDECHSSIFKNLAYPINIFAKYHFLDGHMIPRKYNHLIEDKLKCDNK